MFYLLSIYDLFFILPVIYINHLLICVLIVYHLLFYLSSLCGCLSFSVSSFAPASTSLDIVRSKRVKSILLTLERVLRPYPGLQGISRT